MTPNGGWLKPNSRLSRRAYSRGANSKRGRTREDADEDMEKDDVQDLISPGQMKLCIQPWSSKRDVEAATFCTVFLPRDSVVVTEMHKVGRQYSEAVSTEGSQERGSPRKRRTQTQDVIRQTLLFCGARAPQGRAPRVNQAMQQVEALPKTEKRQGKGATPRQAHCHIL